MTRVTKEEKIAIAKTLIPILARVLAPSIQEESKVREEKMNQILQTDDANELTFYVMKHTEFLMGVLAEQGLRECVEELEEDMPEIFSEKPFKSDKPKGDVPQIDD